MDLTTKNTSTEGGGWVGTVNEVASTINDFLTIKNNLAEKKQKREMQDIQMQQMRMQIQGQQREMQAQDELKSSMDSIQKTKKITLPEDEVMQSYTREEWANKTQEEKAQLLQSEVPISDVDLMKAVTRTQIEHGIKYGKFNLSQTAAMLKQLQAEHTPPQAVTSMKEFEGVTGIDPSSRGTPEYTRNFMQFLKDKSSASMRKYPAFRMDSRLPPGYRFDAYTGKTIGPNGQEVNYDMIGQNSLAWQGAKKEMLTVKGPTFMRLVRNGEILMEGVVDQKTGVRSEPELDKLVRLRNAVDDGAFAKVSNDVRLFNKWDQFINYQTSDPAMAKLKSAIMANAERIGNMYSGGGTVTSDKKIELAMQLLDAPLSKEAFKGLVDMHKESMTSTVLKFSETQKRGIPPPKANAKPLTDRNRIQVYLRQAEQELKAQGIQNPTKEQRRDKATALAIKDGFSVERQ